MSWKRMVASVALFAAAIVACEDVTPTPPSPAFEAMIAAADAIDAADDAGAGAEGGETSGDGGIDAGAE